MRIVTGAVRRLFRLTSLLSPKVVRFSHNRSSVTDLGKMKVKLLSALDDNYMYLLIDEASNECAVVDPVKPDKVLNAVKEHDLNLTCVMTTHHHWDHAGGNEELKKKLGDKKVEFYGGDERIGALSKKVGHNDSFKIGSLNVKCLFTPCHTTGHICYYVTQDKETPAVFTGDTLFSGGCGRFFEGTAEQMHHALIAVLSELPDETYVFCGHEYTVQNLLYAVAVEGQNEYIRKKLDWAKEKRAKKESTIPSSIQEEKKINPFMRVCEPDVQKHTGGTDPIEVMRILRKEKDNFKAKT